MVNNRFARIFHFSYQGTQKKINKNESDTRRGKKAGNEISHVGNVRIEVTYFAQNTILIQFLVTSRDKLKRNRNMWDLIKLRKTFRILLLHSYN